LVILSTIVEILKNQYNKFSLLTKGNIELLLSFSLLRNTRSLFTTNNRFEALDTIRLFLVINVHIGHNYTFTTKKGLVTLKKIISFTSKLLYDNRYVFIRNTPTIMDSFFTMRFESIIFLKSQKNLQKYLNFQNFHKLIQFVFFSGFITSYELLRKLNKTNGSFNYFQFLFHRWIKFSVPLLGSILFFYLFPLFGDGPVWDFGVKRITPGCQNPIVLLKNFLYINNFNRFDEHILMVSKFQILNTQYLNKYFTFTPLTIEPLFLTNALLK
jgi:hypothetical protein